MSETIMADTESGDTSERYEFDAPSHVVDFKELLNAENDDNWFELQAEGVDGHIETPSTPSTPNQLCSTTPPSNIVTSWSAEHEPLAQPRRVSKRKGTSGAVAPPPTKKHKETLVAQKARFVQSNSKLSRRRSERLRSRTTSTHTKPSASEDQELKRIGNLQKEVVLRRKKNEASYKAALTGSPPPKKMVLSTAVPKEFHFNTDDCIKTTTSPKRSPKEVSYVSQLPKLSSPAKARKGATVPKPFNLSRGGKRKVDEPGVYVPVAQQIEQFQKRTPTRYHLHSRKRRERGPSPVKRDHLRLTQPHSPHLMTCQRSRPLTVKSSAELEVEELEKLKKFKVKAVKLNKKILESAVDLKKPTVKEPTQPEGFELEIEKRLQERWATKKTQENEEKPHSFKAKPVPIKVFEGVVGVPEKKIICPTVPESPAFALNKRVRLERKVVEVKQTSPVKAHPLPHFGIPFQPRLPGSHQVEVCPFSFEQREQDRKVLKEKRQEEKHNEQKPQFKAQPLPNFDLVVLPEKMKLQPTKPEPFKLLIDERGAMKHSHWEQTVKEEQKHKQEAAIFKARPNTVTQKQPFRLKKEDRAAVAVEPFELATEKRAREWQEYEKMLSEKELLRSCMEEEQRQEEEQREKQEIARLRQEQVHKAQPIRHYKPVVVKKSEVPLTVPESPSFSDRFRL
ncbi:targeting protein for Xklp2 [Parambassis ranga]|uniref:Targeting protein for Xklp2 n=1 Tax=Parambassis ranga TaxID=210632 RepID=A0A6P7IWE3_9TELE|nr:targeting protein for Xklp2 [Parambassis ranga]